MSWWYAVLDQLMKLYRCSLPPPSDIVFLKKMEIVQVYHLCFIKALIYLFIYVET